jgi:enamine deaminase RidA (YjgF/YER057c/UK114 family)
LEAELFNPSEMSAPVGPYSHVARIPLPGADLLVISGQLAADQTADIVGQTEQVLDQLKLAVEACGGTMRNIIKLTTFTTDLSRRDEVRALRLRYFSEPYPASTLVQVVSLVSPSALVEIEAIALVPKA